MPRVRLQNQVWDRSAERRWGLRLLEACVTKVRGLSIWSGEPYIGREDMTERVRTWRARNPERYKAMMKRRDGKRKYQARIGTVFRVVRQ